MTLNFTMIRYVVFLLCFSVSLFADPYGKYEGCFLTESWNGKPVKTQNQDIVQFKFSRYPARFFSDLNGSSIDSFNFWFFQKYDTQNRSAYHEYIPAFLDRGNFEQSGMTDMYSFKGKLLLKKSKEVYLEQFISLERVGENRYSVYTKSYSPDWHPSLNTTNRFVISKIACKQKGPLN